MGFYKYVGEVWKNPEKYIKDIYKERLIQWNKEEAIVRVERPTRIDRARQIGYKAKKGYVVVRVRIKKGGRNKQRFRGARRPKRMGVRKYTPKKSLHGVSFPNVPFRICISSFSSVFLDLVLFFLFVLSMHGSYYAGSCTPASLIHGTVVWRLFSFHSILYLLSLFPPLSDKFLVFCFFSIWVPLLSFYTLLPIVALSFL